MSRALISAIENNRDSEHMTNFEFRIAAQENFLTEADGYLNDGLVDCICPPCFSSCCRHIDL